MIPLQVAASLSRCLLWDSTLAHVASQYACQTVTMFGIIALIIPTSVVLYVLELRLRCRFYVQTTAAMLVPEISQLLLQQGLLLLCLALGLVLSSWETLVLLVHKSQ